MSLLKLSGMRQSVQEAKEETIREIRILILRIKGLL